MRALYDPEAYFDRLEDLYLRERIPFAQGIVKYWRRHPWTWLKMQALNVVASVVLFVRLMRNVPEPHLRKEYRRRLWRFLRSRPDPNLAILYILKCGLHYHQYTMAREMASGARRVVNSF
jgi:hypothetical protein